MTNENIERYSYWEQQRTNNALEEANRLKRIQLRMMQEQQEATEERERLKGLRLDYSNCTTQVLVRQPTAYYVLKKNGEVEKVSTAEEAMKLHQTGNYAGWTDDPYYIDQMKQGLWDEKYDKSDIFGKIAMLFCGRPREE